jgi:hypothetical protein
LFGLPNFQVESPASEDSSSTQKHIIWLQQAFSTRSKADFGKVQKLMDLTLYKRRQDILDGQSTQSILETYPWLTKSGEASVEEFKRISGKSIDKCLDDYFEEYGEHVVLMIAELKCSELVKSLLDQRGGEHSKYAACCLSILGIVILLNEKINQLMGPEIPEPETSPVFIKCNTSKFVDVVNFEIYVDGLKVCECGDFVEACQVYICCFYIYNLEYKGLRKTMAFVDNVILKLKVEMSGKTQKSVVGLIAKLNSQKEKGARKVHKKKTKKK